MTLPGKSVLAGLARASRRWTFWFLAAGAALSVPSAAAAPPREYQVKAVFLFNFVQFVDWPPGAFADAQSPICIGVVGDDPFGTDLDDVIRGETVGGRPLIVERYRNLADLHTCHVLFVGASEVGRLEEIFAALAHRSILTVGDVPRFAGRGGMIRFVTEKNKIRLRINVEAARAAQLTISSMLLRPATIVRTGED